MATMMNRGTNDESGQAIIELALTLPLLLLIIMGVFDFGLMFQRYEVVTNAAREGARVGVLPDYVDPHQAEIHAGNYLTASGINAGGAVYTAGCGGAISAGRICISAQSQTETIPATATSAAKTIDAMMVTVTYDHDHIFVGPISRLFGNTNPIATRLTAVSRMRKE
jgi:Flp pilus assembly protein TadG